MRDLKVDISIRGPQSSVKTVDANGMVSTATMMTRDIFESISQLSMAALSRRSMWFSALGKDYCMIRYFSEFPKATHVFNEATPCRMPFNGRCVINKSTWDSWNDNMKKLLGCRVIESSSSAVSLHFTTLIDVPYVFMAHRLLMSSDSSYSINYSQIGFMDSSITNEDSEVFYINFPNVSYHPESGLSRICWGTSLQSFGKVDLGATVHLPNLFFNANFNKDLCSNAFYEYGLPLIAVSPDMPFKPFSVESLMINKAGVPSTTFSMRKTTIRSIISAMAANETRS